MGLPDTNDPKAQPQSAPGNTTPVDEQAAPKATAPTAPAPTTAPAPGQSGQAADLRAAEASARDKQAREAAERADQRAQLRRTHAEGLAVAHDNLGHEIDAIIASLGQGNTVTLAQMQALRAAVVGCHGVAHALAEGRVGFDDEA